MLDTGMSLRRYLPLHEALGLHSKSVNGFTASSVLWSDGGWPVPPIFSVFVAGSQRLEA